MSIDDTAQTMFGMRRLNPMSLLQIIREVKSILDAFHAKNSQASEATGYHFTGQHTDIAFVAENGKLNAAEIERIPDEQLRNNVTVSFSDAVKDGYLKFDQESKQFSLTQKGMEHVNSEAFKEQFEKDQLGDIAANKARVELRGNAADLNVFRFTDSISLNHLAHSDPAAFKRVQDYFNECEKYGFVTISDGIVTPTDKCRDYLSRTNIKNFDISRITPDNAKKVAEEMRKATGSSAKQAFESVLDKTENGLGLASKTVSFVSGDSSGSDVAKEGAKIAASQAAKTAQKEAAKRAAQQAAQKAAAKAAASTTAKTAVSSTGYGAAAVAVVELTSKGANALTKMDTQSHKINITRG